MVAILLPLLEFLYALRRNTVPHVAIPELQFTSKHMPYNMLETLVPRRGHMTVSLSVEQVQKMVFHFILYHTTPYASMMTRGQMIYSQDKS